MQLIKEELNKTSSSPRWVYKNNNIYTKIIPFSMDARSTVDAQVELINKVSNCNIILDYEVVKLEETWDSSASMAWDSHTFLKYTMPEVKGELIDISVYYKISTIMEQIIPTYIKYNLSLFPCALFDVSWGNMIGDKLLDWDNVLLGSMYTKDEINHKFIIEVLEAYAVKSGDTVTKPPIQTCIGIYESYISNTILEQSINKERIMEHFKC